MAVPAPDGEPLAWFDEKAFTLAVEATIKARKLTQREASFQAGIHPSTMTRIMQGKNPDVDTLATICIWADLDLRGFIRTHLDAPGITNYDALQGLAVALAKDTRLSGDDARVILDVVFSLYSRLAR